MKIFRAIISVFLSIQFFFSGIGAVKPQRNYKMPEPLTGELTQYVDPMVGTGGIPWTCGMLSPAATVPFGAVRLGADTCAAAGKFLIKMNTSGYYYEHSHILGFSHGRLSGTGLYDYGCFRVTPGKKDNKNGKINAIAFSHKYETAVPGYYALYLPTLDCLAEMTASEHVGIQRYTFYSSKDAHLYIDAASTIGGGTGEDAEISVDTESGKITGSANIMSGFSGRYGGLKLYFAAFATKPIKNVILWEDGTGADLNFGALNGENVELIVGISNVSCENAEQNIKAETNGADFDTVNRQAVEKWENRLNTIKIDADDEIKKTFYTSLYHSMIMPTDFTDSNGEYTGFDKQVHTADGYIYRTDMSLWDTVRNTLPLYSLIATDIQRDCVKSLMNMADAGGTFPRWPQGEGYTGSMFGTPADVFITESYMKGFTDFDVEAAYNYMKKTSESPQSGCNQRDGVEYYNELGYVPADKVNKSVARTLEYSWSDGCIADLASALEKTDEAAYYRTKSEYYKNVWNPDTKYYQGRNADGSWKTPLLPNFTEFYDAVLIKKVSDAYCEGSARQWRFGTVYNTKGTIELFGSKDYFVSELEDFMKDASRNRAALNPGAGFWIGNQHDIHTPYMFIDAERPDLTQKWVRWTLANRYSNDINGLDGNDDGGTLSAWYVFSAMGFYPIAGTARYYIGSPNINSAVLSLGNGETLTVKVNNQSEKNVYVKSVKLNGKPLDEMYISHDELTAGGVLEFTMG